MRQTVITVGVGVGVFSRSTQNSGGPSLLLLMELRGPGEKPYYPGSVSDYLIREINAFQLVQFWCSLNCRCPYLNGRWCSLSQTECNKSVMPQKARPPRD